jgi:hypothetical protein
LHSELQLNRLLRLYMCVHADTPQVTNSEWDSIVEIEGVLNVSKYLTTLMQYKPLYNGAFGQIIKHVTLKRLRASTIPVIDMPKVTYSKVRKTQHPCLRLLVVPLPMLVLPLPMMLFMVEVLVVHEGHRSAKQEGR